MYSPTRQAIADAPTVERVLHHLPQHLAHPALLLVFGYLPAGAVDAAAYLLAVKQAADDVVYEDEQRAK